ncbi:unnamed protein product [Amoebophrya sp. A25]|nr:unnamed protein product [Amoebophrya sp. A25]|eukprot:GSA25T00015722001.1
MKGVVLPKNDNTASPKMKSVVRPNYDKYQAVKEAERKAAEEAEAARVAAEEAEREAAAAAEEQQEKAADEQKRKDQPTASHATYSTSDVKYGFGHVTKAREKELKVDLPPSVGDYAQKREAFAKGLQTSGVFPTAHRNFYSGRGFETETRAHKDLKDYDGSNFRGREQLEAAKQAKKKKQPSSNLIFETDESGRISVAPGQKIGKQMKEADAAAVDWSIGVNSEGAATVSAEGRANLIKNTALALNPNGFPFWLHLQRVVTTFVATRESTSTDELVSALLTYAGELDEQAVELTGIKGYAQVVRKRIPEIRSLCERKEAVDNAFLWIQKYAKHEVEAGAGEYPLPSGKIRGFAKKYDDQAEEAEMRIRKENEEREKLLRNHAENEIKRRQAEVAAKNAEEAEILGIAEEEQKALEAFLVKQRAQMEKDLRTRRRAGSQAAERYMGELMLTSCGDKEDFDKDRSRGYTKYLDALRNYATDRATSSDGPAVEITALTQEVLETAQKLDQIATAKGQPTGFVEAAKRDGGKNFEKMMSEVIEIAAAVQTKAPANKRRTNKVSKSIVPPRNIPEAEATAGSPSTSAPVKPDGADATTTPTYDPDTHLAIRHPSLYKMVDFHAKAKESLEEAKKYKPPKKEIVIEFGDSDDY